MAPENPKNPVGCLNICENSCFQMWVLEMGIQYFNPKQAGIFGRSKGRGGGGAESAHGFFPAPVLLISMQINPNTISNESWHLYLPVESLNITLSWIVLPWGGAEVAYFDRGNILAFSTTIFENSSFLTYMDNMCIKWKLKTFYIPFWHKKQNL